MAKKTEPLYASMTDPDTFRKNLLYCSKDIITSLKNYEEYKTLKVQRAELTMDLQNVMAHMKTLMNKITQTLPKTGKAEPTQKVTPQVVKKEPTRMQHLESELARIEAKLQDMG